jgi:hypothetical protein
MKFFSFYVCLTDSSITVFKNKNTIYAPPYSLGVNKLKDYMKTRFCFYGRNLY